MTAGGFFLRKPHCIGFQNLKLFVFPDSLTEAFPLAEAFRGARSCAKFRFGREGCFHLQRRLLSFIVLISLSIGLWVLIVFAGSKIITNCIMVYIEN